MRRKSNKQSKLNLQESCFSPEYLDRLAAGFNLLRQWFFSQKPPLTITWDRAGVNFVLIMFVQSMYDANAPLYLVTHAILAFDKCYPRFHGKLKPTWNSIKSWKLQRSVSLRVPLPPHLLSSIVLCCLMHGFLWEPWNGHIWIPFGIQLWLGFEALLRPGEMNSIRRKDLSLPSGNPLSFHHCLLVLICDPKNKASFGRMQTAIVRNKSLILWLEWLCGNLPDSARLTPIALNHMRKLFQSILRKLSIHKVGFTLASLRAGKATSMYIEGVPLDRLRFEGRWQSMGTLEHYVQEASAVSVLNSLKPSAVDIISTMLGCSTLLEAPPDKPWQYFFSRNSQLSRLSRLPKPCSRQKHKL